jgi:hypothetical protein
VSVKAIEHYLKLTAEYESLLNSLTNPNGKQR